MNFVLNMPKDKNLRELTALKFSELAKHNDDQSKFEISSHWQKYLPGVKINISPRRGWVHSKILIDQQGIASLSNINLSSIISNLLSIIRIFYLAIKFKCDTKIFYDIFKISIKTSRLINFDMIKHAILISKIKNKIDILYFSNFVIIGDGYGFLGTL